MSLLRQAQECQQAQTDDYTGQRAAGSNLQSGRELVVIDPSSDTTRNPQTPANDQTSGRQERLEWERLEQEKREQERLEHKKQEQERLEKERLEKEKQEQEMLWYEFILRCV